MCRRLCVPGTCFPSLSSHPQVRSSLLLSPFSRHRHWGLARPGTLPRLSHPAAWCGLVWSEPGHLTVVLSSPLSSRGSRVHHGIPDGGSIRRELSASPLGSLGWAPVVGVQCPKGWPSLSLSCSQPAGRALLGLPAGLGWPCSSSGGSVPRSPSAGHSRAAPSPWGWWPGHAARPLCGLLCPPVQRGHGTALPSHMWHQWGSSHPGGGQPGCRPRGLPQEEARGKGLAWALTPRQVFVSTESIVNPGVSLPCSVGGCFLIFINAYFNLNLRLIPVQFHVENF